MQGTESHLGTTVLKIVGIIFVIAAVFIVASNPEKEPPTTKKPVHSQPANQADNDQSLGSPPPISEQKATLLRALPTHQNPRDLSREVPSEVVTTERGFAPDRLPTHDFPLTPEGDLDRESNGTTKRQPKITSAPGTIQDHKNHSPDSIAPIEIRATPSAPLKAR